jgi:hypothetical protein
LVACKTAKRSLSTVSAEAAGKSRSTFVDPTFPLHEFIQRFRGRLVCRESQRTSPFRASALIDLCRISGTANDGGKWFFLIEWNDMPQAQGLVSAFDGTVFSRPPRNQLKHGCQIGVDCVSLPAGLAIVPSTPHSQEVLSQCLRRVRYFVPNGFFQSRRNQPKIRVHSCEICHCSNQSNWIELQPGRPSHYGNSSNSSRASRFPVRFGRFVMRGEPTRNAKVSRCPVPILPYLDWPYWLCANQFAAAFRNNALVAG